MESGRLLRESMKKNRGCLGSGVSATGPFLRTRLKKGARYLPVTSESHRQSAIGLEWPFCQSRRCWGWYFRANERDRGGGD